MSGDRTPLAGSHPASGPVEQLQFLYLYLHHRLRGNEMAGRIMLGRIIPDSLVIILPNIILPLSLYEGVSIAVVAPPRYPTSGGRHPAGFSASRSVSSP